MDKDGIIVRVIVNDSVIVNTCDWTSSNGVTTELEPLNRVA